MNEPLQPHGLIGRCSCGQADRPERDGRAGDAANIADLDRLFETIKREKGRIDILYASAGTGEALPQGEITEQHFDATFNLNAPPEDGTRSLLNVSRFLRYSRKQGLETRQ